MGADPDFLTSGMIIAGKDTYVKPLDTYVKPLTFLLT